MEVQCCKCKAYKNETEIIIIEVTGEYYCMECIELDDEEKEDFCII